MMYLRHILLLTVVGFNYLMAHGQDSSCAERKLFQRITFAKKRTKLTRQDRIILDSVIAEWNKCQKLTLVMTHSYSACHHNKMIWDRANSVGNYIYKKVQKSRDISLNYDDSHSCDIVSFKLMEIEQTIEAPPHPGMRKKEGAESKNKQL